MAWCRRWSVCTGRRRIATRLRIVWVLSREREVTPNEFAELLDRAASGRALCARAEDNSPEQASPGRRCDAQSAPPARIRKAGAIGRIGPKFH
jgi:hypothetical protein